MMNGVTSELKASDHHQVDEQDRDAHRGEQAAEGLGLLRGHASEPDIGARRDRPGVAQTLDRAPRTAADVAPVSPLVISAVIVADGLASIRVMRPWTSAWLDGRDRARAGPAWSADRQRAELLDRVQRLGIEPNDERDRRFVAQRDPTDGRGRERAPDCVPTWAAVMPIASAFVRVHADLDLRRGLRRGRSSRFVRLGSPASARRTASVVDSTTAASSAVTMT